MNQKFSFRAVVTVTIDINIEVPTPMVDDWATLGLIAEKRIGLITAKGDEVLNAAVFAVGSQIGYDYTQEELHKRMKDAIDNAVEVVEVGVHTTPGELKYVGFVG